MAKIEWNQVKMSDIQLNILSGGEDGTSAADALQARSEAYQASKSHGAARFFKGLFSLGINEIWRFANYRGYESDKAKIVNCVKDVYKALAPKLGPEEITIVFHEDDGHLGNVNNDSKISSTPHVGQSSRNVKLMEAKATIERKADGSGLITINGKDEREYIISDCEQLRRNLEVAMARDAKHFGRDFVMGILNKYKASATADARESDAGYLHFGENDNKQTIGLRRGMASLNLATARSDEARNAVEAHLQDQTVKSSARAHLKSMLAAFYSANLDLPEEVGRTMDLELGVEFVGKVLNGEITDGKKLQAFLDKGSKDSHLTTAEGQRVMVQFDKAIAEKDASVDNVTINANALSPKNPRETLPQGEIKKLHDFVADLVMNEDNTEYDKSLDTGKLTGRRLRMLVVQNRELVASLMEKKGAALDAALKTLEPRMAKVLKETVLAPLEKKYQEYIEGQRNNGRDKVPRAEWLEQSVTDSQVSAAKLRVALGVRNADEINSSTLDTLTVDREVRKNLEKGGADLKNISYLSTQAGRKQIALGLDFFAEKEKELEAAVADALKDVQEKIIVKLDTIFGQDASTVVNKSAEQLGNMNLQEMKEAYSKDPDITLIKKTLRTYFKDIGPLQQRQMLSAQTRFCAEVPGKTTDGARLGALLKGAGPVMQKMLQGIDMDKLGDDEFKLALTDMKDSLAPISDKAIKAHLFDLMKNSEAPKIVSIEVKGSLGQASVGQALLCTVKREGLQAQECVVKILRPNANLAAQREHDLFITACGNDESLEATFEGRFKSIEEELDLTIEARNMEIADKTYAYNKDVPEIGTFTNTTSAKLFAGVKPTSSVMMQEKAEGTTVKKFLDDTRERLADPNAHISQDELQAMKEKLQKTHSALVSTSYMWANEGLFGNGFYHGDLHAGNLMVEDDGKITMIDFGNATQLDKAGRMNVTRVITGAAVCDVDLFLKGYVAMLGGNGKANYAEKEAEIKAKLGKVFGHQGLGDTALRMNIALNILQLDYKIEVPGAVHNFLESQKRLSSAMDETASILGAINAKLGVDNAPKPLSMMQCLVQVVKNNISINLLKTIGLRNAGNVMNTIQQDPLLQQQGNPDANKVVINP